MPDIYDVNHPSFVLNLFYYLNIIILKNEEKKLNLPLRIASLSSSDIALRAPFLKYSFIYASYSALAFSDSSLRSIM